MEIDADRAKEGLKTAVAELHDPSEPPVSEAEQLKLPALPLAVADGSQAMDEPRRGPGRPVGAKNKNTEAWRSFILARHRSPLEALAQTFNRSVAALAKELGCEKLEAFKLQIAAAKELAPYVHQKMPIAVDGGEGGLIQLVINQHSVTAQAGGDAVPAAIEILNTPDEEDQLVSDVDFEETAQSRHTAARGDDSDSGESA